MPTNVRLNMTTNYNHISHFKPAVKQIFYILNWPLHIPSKFRLKFTKVHWKLWNVENRRWLRWFGVSVHLRFIFDEIEKCETKFACINDAFPIRCLIVDWLHEPKRIVALNSKCLVRSGAHDTFSYVATLHFALLASS